MQGMKNMRHAFGAALLAATICGYFAAPANAVPNLQLFIEGATYVGVPEETWVGSGSTVRLWVIGDTSGGTSPIANIKLIAAYDSVHPAGTVGLSFTPSTTGGLGGFTDPSTPSAPVPLGENTSGGVPQANDGTGIDTLPGHGIFGPSTFFQEFSLGDMTLSDSPIGDFITSFPSPLAATGQINVYEITISGLLPGFGVHFDAHGTQLGKNVFAPFSHDAETTGGPSFDIPEPASSAALAFALIGLGWVRRRSQKAA